MTQPKTQPNMPPNTNMIKLTPIKRCALYTRKSSEEGLEQGFNSLDAQREACAAYVKSQKAEGWTALATVYDDGGYSGGTIERPALIRLLADIEAGKIDVVVVYKIDRLTRSLTDFARIVELFERRQVSFVSVTQAFNTTSSMGRLTLNVLLSFAQFEREVTGERIRDKIAASKAKGMWMGGNLPLGYDRPVPGTRTLIINTTEAATVQAIFNNYLELGSVHTLERHLRNLNIRSKLSVSQKGKCRGGACFNRGALFHLLRNRIYLGEITHRGTVHPGLHQAIVERDLFNAVQTKLDAQKRRNESSDRTVAHSPLTGRIFDADGMLMSPAFAHGRNSKIYRYYVSACLQRGGKREPDDHQPRRVAAAILERYLTDRLSLLHSNLPVKIESCNVLDLIRRIDVYARNLIITLPITLKKDVMSALGNDEHVIVDPESEAQIRLTLSYISTTRRGRTEILSGGNGKSRPDPILIRALRRAHSILKRDNAGAPWLEIAPPSPHLRKLVHLAFLAPDIQRDILGGRQPRDLTLATLLDGDMPLLWSEQRKRVSKSVDN